MAIGARLTVFFVMFSWLAAGVTRADASGPAPTDNTAASRAKQHFSLGEGYFKSRKFEEALAEYQLGYLEKPSSVFTFNMAQCQRLLGRRGPAIELYRRYLVEAPDGVARTVAEQRIAQLTAEGKGEDTLVTPPPAGPVQAPATSPVALGSQAPATPLPPTTAAMSASDSISGAPSPQREAPAPASSPLETAPKPSVGSLLAVKAPAPTPAVSVSARAEEDESPIYRRWWFWVAAAAVATGTVVAIAASSSDRPACAPDRICK